MKSNTRKKHGVAAILAALVVASPAWGQSETETAAPDAGAPAAPSPLQRGFYVAPMATYAMPYGNRGFDDGIGAALAIGYRYGELALELAAEYAELDAESGDASGELTGYFADLMWFPFHDRQGALAGLYALGAVGSLKTENQPVGDLTFTNGALEVGAGYLLPLAFGRYEFGVRAEVRERFSERGRDIAFGDDNLPRRYQDTLINLGLQLPLGRKAPPPPPPAPVAVVAAPSQCSDGIDNDGDGLIDYPNDKGCLSPDDNDETNPQCSDGIDNDGDGLVDFPADKGCTDENDIDETDPCKKPAPGERINLSGCGTGDVIVLRGVNFEFDKATLTANAKTILDNVADELKAYPTIEVELGGHTDSKGSDEYNQVLSERRADAVMLYLVEAGVAESRMRAVGYGELQPIADNETDEGRELNRRTELKIVGGSAAGPVPAVGPEPAPLSESP